MFNRTIVLADRRPVSTYAHASITEKRAPTDESVALLKDLEREAQKKIEVSVRLSDNKFDCVVHVERSSYEQKTHYKIMYSLNGERHSMDKSFDFDHTESREDIAIELRDELAKDIAANMLSSAFRKADFLGR
jgi:hypothetical protein